MEDVIYLLSPNIPNNMLLKWYNSIYYVYRSIWTYSYSKHHPIILIIVSESTDIFWILCPVRRLAVPVYCDWLLMYLEGAKKMLLLRCSSSAIYICAFFYSNVLNIGSLIYLYNDLNILRISCRSGNGIHILLNIMSYLSLMSKKSKYVVAPYVFLAIQGIWSST